MATPVVGIDDCEPVAEVDKALLTGAIAIPVLLTFLVLMMSRPAIPRRPLMLERLNWARSKAGKRPLLPDYLRGNARAGAAVRSRTVTWTIESPRSGPQG